MASYGYTGDVNNSISGASAYPGRRTQAAAAAASTRYGVRNNSMGELTMAKPGAGAAPMAARQAQAPAADNNGITGKPVGWWLTIVVIFIAVVFLGRKFAPDTTREFGNLKPGLYNLTFLLLYIVIGLSVLKVGAAKVANVPGLRSLSDLILAI